MGVEVRPTDVLTENWLLFGMPIFEFGLKNANGTFNPYQSMGIVDDAAIAKTLAEIPLNSSQAGLQRKIAEIVSVTEAQLNVGLLKFDPVNFRYFLGSKTFVEVSAGATVVTDDPFVLTDDDQDFFDLANANLTEPITGVECDLITDEVVGTVTAALRGEILGDFSLDFKPLDTVTDVTQVRVTEPDGTFNDYVPVAIAAAATLLEVEIEDFGDDTTNAGRMQFHSAGVAVELTIGASITATYRPGHVFTEATDSSAGDFVIDYVHGRVRFFAPSTATVGELKDFQPMRADYTYTATAHHTITPFTQNEFEGRGRLRLLPDGARLTNLIWPIPKLALQLGGDDFAFSKDGFAIGSMSVELLDDGTATPYGTAQVHRGVA